MPICMKLGNLALTGCIFGSPLEQEHRDLSSLSTIFRIVD